MLDSVPSCAKLFHMDAVEVNGPAIRALRQALRVEIADLATEIGVSRAYLCKVELGHSRRMSVGTLGKLEDSLRVTDRRALVARPYDYPVPDEKAGAA